MKKYRIRAKNALVLLLLAVSIPVIWHLLLPGFYKSDDGEWMIIRFAAFYNELRNFQFPVRLLTRLNFGFGYPVATFLYPGFMYAASVFKVIGFSFVDSVKLIIIVSILTGSIFTYYWLRNKFSAVASLLGSLVYLYNPYLLWDIYKRGSVGEVMAIGITPVIFWALGRKKWVTASIVLSILIISHNTVALLMIPLIVSVLLVTLARNRIEITMYIGLFALGVSAFFWLPVLTELPLTRFNSIVISNPADYFLFMNSPLLLSTISVAALLLSLMIMVRSKKMPVSLIIFAVFYTFSVFMSSEYSQLFWKNQVIARLIQFPFRFLSVAIIAGAYLTAYAMHNVHWRTKIGLILISVFSAVTSLFYIVPSERIIQNDSYYESNDATTTVHDEYLPVWVTDKPTQRPQNLIELKDDSTAVINRIYWPGYRVMYEKVSLPISYSNPRGLMEVPIRSGMNSDEISIRFSETPLRIFSVVLSIITLLVLLFYGKKVFD